MSPRICICCGEPIGEWVGGKQEDPNLCHACLHFQDIADGQTGPGHYRPIERAADLADEAQKQDLQNAS